MTTLSATDLARRLSDILSRVRYRGERFVVERNGEPVAVLVPLGSEAAPPVAPTLREVVDRLGSLQLPGEGYAADLAATRAPSPTPEPPAWPT
jgi:prevent-host-death family protein